MPILSNPRHERFAQELAKGKSASEAYVIAGYQKDDGNACRLTGNDKVQARIAELKERSAMRTELTVASITENLLRISEKAEQLGEASGLAVARAAQMDAAKLNGLIVERTENVNLNHDISGELPTDEEWEQEHATKQ